MKKIILSLSILMLFTSSPAFSETIYLKDGRVVKGKIVDKASYYVTIMDGKVPYKYYMDQIDRIEEDKEGGLNFAAIDISQFVDISEEKVKLILTFLETNGTHQNIERSIEQIIAQSPQQREVELAEMLNVNEIIKNLVPIYDKYYSADELKELIQFYGSSVRKKELEVTPKIMKDTMETTIKYFQDKTNQ